MENVDKILLDVDSRKKLINNVVKFVNNPGMHGPGLFSYYNNDEKYPCVLYTVDEKTPTHTDNKLFRNSISTHLGINFSNTNRFSSVYTDYGIVIYYYQKVRINANQCFFGNDAFKVPKIVTKEHMTFQIIGFKTKPENKKFIIFYLDNDPGYSFIVPWETSLFDNYDNSEHLCALNLINLNQKILFGYYKLVEKMKRDDTPWLKDPESFKVKSVAYLTLFNNRKLKKRDDSIFKSKFPTWDITHIVNHPKKFKAIDGFIIPENSKNFRNDKLSRLVLTLYISTGDNLIRMSDYYYRIPLMSFLDVDDS